MKKNNKGFTLAELLIVVAIIAVLVAISIPIFTAQLERAREATDAANIRAAYAEIVAAALTEPERDDLKATVEKKQQVDDWQNTSIEDIAGVAIADIKSTDATEIKYTPNTTDATGSVTIDGVPATTSFLDATAPDPTP